jgi:hypothetical protein
MDTNGDKMVTQEEFIKWYVYNSSSNNNNNNNNNIINKY